jgi:hypothetical protein
VDKQITASAFGYCMAMFSLIYMGANKVNVAVFLGLHGSKK